MTERWRNAYGDEACRQICEQAQQEPLSTFCLLRPEAEEELRAAGAVLRPGAFLANARYPGQGTFRRTGMDRIRAQIQDEGSQLIAELLGTGERILDCCAAPGGKAAVLLRNNPQAEFVAADIHTRRLQATEKRLRVLFPERRIDYRIADAAKLGDIGPKDSSQEDTLKFQSFDRILCDVPCTGTGTLARNPEIRHRLQPDDLERQVERQRAILSAAIGLLSPGGRLLYSTCSLEPEENEQVVEACLAMAPEFQLMNLLEEFDRLAHEGIVRGDAVGHLRETAFRNGYLRTIPGLHPCDGFFAALIKRK
jgi:16S rRNA (cytosine967-C5)-methyltransferase